MPSNRYVSPEYGTFPLPAIAMGKTGEPQELTVAGAVSVLTEPTQFNLSQAGDQAMTMVDGDESQRQLLYMTGKGSTGNAVVTPDTLTGGTTLTFSAVGHYAELRFVAGSWVMIAGTAALV